MSGPIRRGAGRWVVAWLIAALGGPTIAPGVDEATAPTYERDIRPLFARRCTICHSRKNLGKADVSGGLALDTYEAALAGTGEHAVVVAGEAGSSELFRRLVDPDEERRMPLSEDPLSGPQSDLIRRWIDAGAPRGVARSATATETAAETSTEHATHRPARRIVRTLDVVVPTEAKGPPGREGSGPGGPLSMALKVGPLPPVTALAFRPDGRQLAVGTFGAVVVWDLSEGKPSLILDDLPGQVHALAFDRDGGRLAIGAGLPARSGCLRVYSFPEGSIVRDFPGHGDVVFGLAFSPDGRRLASASFDQTIRLWDLEPAGAGAEAGEGKESGGGEDEGGGVFHGHSDFVNDVAFGADGATLLSVSKDRSIKRIDLGTLKERRTYSDHNEDVLALAIHPNGDRFVTAGDEPQIRWWGFDDVKPAMKVGGHSGPVHQLAFSGDGRRLISAGADGSVRLWDGSTGVLLRSLPGAAEWQYAATLSGDARLAAAGGWDGLVRLWDAESGKLRLTLLQAPATDSTAVDWLAAVPSGFVSASQSLRPLLRWRAGGKDVDDPSLLDHFLRPEEIAKAWAGEATDAAASKDGKK